MRAALLPGAVGVVGGSARNSNSLALAQTPQHIMEFGGRGSGATCRLHDAHSLVERARAGGVDGGAGERGDEQSVDHCHVVRVERHPMHDARSPIPSAVPVTGEVHGLVVGMQQR
ncbi:hypothetical protein GCM10007304_03880 [Rhodococcoides trifolii]|uniref:Uncharacterized protein n=1 Tax=Rhodococcoides trifolii TaxID=908250 RepID=A0A917CPL8_9NOCA|nr:hypothetical protein [Rhodococcus trifolii]GGF93258.1 hypothetical protein GCM10007304_03880 [Rhodococcus trifolii]